MRATESKAEVSFANEKLDVSLAREEETKVASQKMIDDVAINSTSKLKENGNWSAKVLENERVLSKKKTKRQHEQATKLLERGEVDNS